MYLEVEVLDQGLSILTQQSLMLQRRLNGSWRLESTALQRKDDFWSSRIEQSPSQGERDSGEV